MWNQCILYATWLLALLTAVQLYELRTNIRKTTGTYCYFLCTWSLVALKTYLLNLQQANWVTLQWLMSRNGISLPVTPVTHWLIHPCWSVQSDSFGLATHWHLSKRGDWNHKKVINLKTERHGYVLRPFVSQLLESTSTPSAFPHFTSTNMAKRLGAFSLKKPRLDYRPTQLSVLVIFFTWMAVKCSETNRLVNN